MKKSKLRKALREAHADASSLRARVAALEAMTPEAFADEQKRIANRRALSAQLEHMRANLYACGPLTAREFVPLEPPPA